MRNKKIKFHKTWAFFIGIVVIIFFTNVLAQQPTKEKTQPPAPNESQAETSTTSEKQPVAQSEDFFLAGQSVDVKSANTIGDVAVAGADIVVSGKTQGYVLAAGANVNINAPVGNDVWAAGANVTVNESVADNAMLAGSSVIIGPNGTIGNDARIAAASVDLKGKIKRNLYIASSNAEISSEVGGDVVAYVENMTLNPGAVVKGKLVIYSPNQPIISPEAKVVGNVEYHQTESERESQSYSAAIGSWLSGWFLTFLWFVVLGLVGVWFSSVWTNRVAEILKEQTGKSFLVGLVVMLLVPILFILLIVTVVGVPLALLLCSLALVAFLFSGIFVAYLVGDLLLKRLKRWENSNVLKIIFGALILTFVMSLPWIGWLAKLAVMFFGVGAFLLERRELLHKLQEQGLA
jgi:hypothetical protein